MCRYLALCLAVLVAAACGSGDHFRECTSNAECDQAGIPGTCRPSPVSDKKWCSFPDTSCPAPPAERWGALAGDGLAEMCVDQETMDGGMPDARPVDGGGEPDAPIADAAPMPDATPGVPADMADVPAGLFKRGCNAASEGPCSDTDNVPYADVTLSEFWIDRTEVTQAAYQMCLGAGACTAPAGDFDPIVKADYPVERVSWQQAVDYCTWAGKRLPNEAEWEKGARGFDGRAFPWGNSAADCTKAHYNNCSGGTEAVQVATHLAGDSPYGVHDMAGNVIEWVADWYGSMYYQVAPSVDPPGPTMGTTRVFRGGGAGYGDTYMHASKRSSTAPANQFNNVGFRCAQTPP